MDNHVDKEALAETLRQVSAENALVSTDLDSDSWIQRRNTPTSSGGTYTIAHFLDASGNPVAKSKAVQFRIFDFDDEGNCLNRMWGTTGLSSEDQS